MVVVMAHSHHHHHDDAADPQDGLAEILDLDAKVFAPYLAAVTTRLADLTGDGVKHIVDIGAGTGTGTLALLERFPDARVTAVDSSPAMLARLTAAARGRGVGDRVHTLETDAGAGLPGLEDVDLVWASASMHHLDDPTRALAGIGAALRPGGLLAVLETDRMPRFLPDDAPAERPGLEARCHEALTAIRTEQMPHLGADWGALITAAGFVVEDEQTERLDLGAPLPVDLGRYAYVVLSRIRGAVEERVDAADLAALDALLDDGPQGVRRRDDLRVRSTRQLWIARRGQAVS